MRRQLLVLALPFAVACGDKVEHPAAAPACDPATMNCVGLPPDGGGVGVGGGEGGEGATGGDVVTDWSGQVLSYTGDDFEQGVVFDGKADISATGTSGARVTGSYDGSTFTLSGVLKDANNWFLVEPAAATGVLPTLTPVDTRATKADALAIGIVREADIDGIFTLSLASTERSTSRAQVVVHVVDDQGRTVKGVQAAVSAELTAYRGAGTWDSSEGAATDDSGLIFLGNVPATQSIAVANIVFRGSVSARVEARIKAGATTVLTAVVSPP
jgi:hypothetical protein